MVKSLVAIASASLMIAASTTLARADDIDKKTTLTVKEALLIPGRTLPPGKYVMKLQRATANRHIVQIFNEDENKLEATIMAFNNYRIRPTGDTVLQYWETPAGSPPALRAWFYPGDDFGQEFAYPKDIAEKLARQNNNATVPSYEATTTSPDADQLAKLEVRDYDTTPAPKVQAQVPPNPKPQEVAPAPVTPPTARETPTETATAPAPPASDTTLLAQNSPAPQTAQNTQTTPSTQSVPASSTTYKDDVRAEELPRTATNLPLIMLLGLISVAAAIGVRFVNKA